ncbi:cell surface protein [Lactobacillus sp. S2-2]|uniref:CdaR family protein n=1 Tax=Lactobacillus sp. S2-2 TaxID=2692917 RepID=UPI001EEEC8D7|nr:CdaR family protein [Lactobacillus sp. S2-2]MCF6515716.1 cell surface protein [Lactobacillus sp. S2-2]
MNKFFKGKWFYLILSLIFALALFVYVNGSKLSLIQSGNSNSDNQSILSSNKTTELTVPLQLNVDSNKYFVSGYPEKVKIKLNGPSALVTTISNTQNFKAYANLSDLKPGNHTVKIQQEGLNNEIKYKFKPETIKVNLQPRRTVDFPVNAKYDKNAISNGYKLGEPKIDVNKVKITGAEDQINRVQSVVADLKLPSNTSKTVNKQSVIEALDKDGRTVNVVVTPSTTFVNLPVTASKSKEVPLELIGENNDNKLDYSLSTNTKNVRVFGNDNQLSKINKFKVKVDLKDIEKSRNKNVYLDSGLNKVDIVNPNSIKVNININKNK